MDIQAAVVPQPSKTSAAEKKDKADVHEKTAQTSEGRAAVQGFAQLLQDGLLPQPDDVDALPALALTSAPALPVETLIAGMADAAAPALTLDGGQELQAVDISSLVGQTALMDGVADRAVQDGSVLLARQEAGLLRAGAGGAQMWGAQPQMGWGQPVATVAAGVQSAQPSTLLEGGAVLGAALAVTSEATGVLQDGMQSVTDALKLDDTNHARVALHGAWKLDDGPVPSPMLQRVMGHIEQWVAATSASNGKLAERSADGSKSVAEATAALAAGQGSGTRLMDTAVREAQQSQTASHEHQAEVAQDMRFWLQGKQQRAEVVLDQDGQPVRIQVALRGQEAHVTFHSDQQQTRAMLDSSLAQLREMLEQQGVALAGVTVQAEAGQQSASQERGQTPSAAWQGREGRALHGQVSVPVTEQVSPARRGLHSVDLYA